MPEAQAQLPPPRLRSGKQLELPLRRGAAIAPSQESQLWTPADLAKIAAIAPPVVRRIYGRLKAYPDMSHYLPSRLVSREEARLNDWPFFYEGAVCLRNHISTRYTANGGCLDCYRASRGLPTIGIQIQLDTPSQEGVETQSGEPQVAQTAEET